MVLRGQHRQTTANLLSWLAGRLLASTVHLPGAHCAKPLPCSPSIPRSQGATCYRLYLAVRHTSQAGVQEQTPKSLSFVRGCCELGSPGRPQVPLTRDPPWHKHTLPSSVSVTQATSPMPSAQGVCPPPLLKGCRGPGPSNSEELSVSQRPLLHGKGPS